MQDVNEQIYSLLLDISLKMDSIVLELENLGREAESIRNLNEAFVEALEE